MNTSSASAQIYRVLIVDDNTFVRSTYRRFLAAWTDCRFSCVDAVSLDEAKNHLTSQLFDALLLDYELDGECGLELFSILGQLFSEGPHPPVIVITGAGDERIAVQAMQRGAYTYMVKDDVGQLSLPINIGLAIQAATKARRLQEAQEEMSRFTAVASHDLRSPIANIATAAMRLEKYLAAGETEKCQKLVSIIQSSTSSSLNLIQSLLNYTDSQNLERSLASVDLNQVVKQVEDNLHQELENKAVQLSCDQLPQVLGDPTRLYQLFLNLISNAIKYAKPGPIEIQLLCTTAPDDSLARIDVVDNGLGMSREQLTKAFIPFKRFHHDLDVNGHGLGLATCKRIVEHMQGQISLASEPGAGTTVHLDLRRA